MIVNSSTLTIGSSDDYCDDDNGSEMKILNISWEVTSWLVLGEACYWLELRVDVLDFWNTSSIRYPKLSMMAQGFSIILDSTIVLESSVNVGGKTYLPN